MLTSTPRIPRRADADIDWQGKPRKVMLWANRNGFVYVLDRVTGEFLLGKAFVRQNWNFFALDGPIAFAVDGHQYVAVSAEGRLVRFRIVGRVSRGDSISSFP